MPMTFGCAARALSTPGGTLILLDGSRGDDVSKCSLTVVGPAGETTVFVFNRNGDLLETQNTRPPVIDATPTPQIDMDFSPAPAEVDG